MKSLKIKKLALALGTLAFAGIVQDASAFPTFYIQPGAIKGPSVPGGVGPADGVSGNASELLTPGAGNTFTGQGILLLTTLNNNDNTNDIYSFKSDGNFRLYITFTFTDTLTGGTFGQPGSSYTINNLDFRLFADVNGDGVFSGANANGPSGPGTAPSFSNQGDDKLLGFGSLLGGNAFINSGGGSTGAALNSSESFSLCSGLGQAKLGSTTQTAVNDPRAGECQSNIGTAFLFNPVPFYNVAFDEFNNTSVTSNAFGQIALSGGTGSIRFAIPEPDGLALFGVAAVAAGLAARRRRKI